MLSSLGSIAKNLYGIFYTISVLLPTALFAFSALTLLAGRQEEHLAYKN